MYSRFMKISRHADRVGLRRRDRYPGGNPAPLYRWISGVRRERIRKRHLRSVELFVFRFIEVEIHLPGRTLDVGRRIQVGSIPFNYIFGMFGYTSRHGGEELFLGIEWFQI